MKKNLLLIPFILFFSCSSPKFAANQSADDAKVAGASNASSKQATDGESVLTASTKAIPNLAVEEARAEIKKNYLNLSIISKQLSEIDDKFPPYGLWVEYYNVKDLNDIIIIINKKKKMGAVL